ncbi:hypothetical protein HDU67_010441, partial [Dinochytrium kinnereticum]
MPWWKKLASPAKGVRPSSLDIKVLSARPIGSLPTPTDSEPPSAPLELLQDETAEPPISSQFIAEQPVLEPINTDIPTLVPIISVDVASATASSRSSMSHPSPTPAAASISTIDWEEEFAVIPRDEVNASYFEDVDVDDDTALELAIAASLEDGRPPGEGLFCSFTFLVVIRSCWTVSLFETGKLTFLPSLLPFTGRMPPSPPMSSAAYHGRHHHRHRHPSHDRFPSQRLTPLKRCLAMLRRTTAAPPPSSKDTIPQPPATTTKKGRWLEKGKGKISLITTAATSFTSANYTVFGSIVPTPEIIVTPPQAQPSSPRITLESLPSEVWISVACYLPDPSVFARTCRGAREIIDGERDGSNLAFRRDWLVRRYGGHLALFYGYLRHYKSPKRIAAEEKTVEAFEVAARARRGGGGVRRGGLAPIAVASLIASSFSYTPAFRLAEDE